MYPVAFIEAETAEDWPMRSTSARGLNRHLAAPQRVTQHVAVEPARLRK